MTVWNWQRVACRAGHDPGPHAGVRSGTQVLHAMLGHVPCKSKKILFVARRSYDSVARVALADEEGVVEVHLAKELTVRYHSHFPTKATALVAEFPDLAARQDLLDPIALHCQGLARQSICNNSHGKYGHHVGFTGSSREPTLRSEPSQ